MKLTLSKSVVTSKYQHDSIQGLKSRVTALGYSSDNTRLAVATADRYISLYNNQGKLVDKFQTKPNSGGPKDYVVRALRFGSNAGHPKLAIAQSDAIVFVYKWKQANDGSKKEDVWDGKKSICNKFPEQSAVTTLIWSGKQPHQIVYGLLEGKVKIGNLRSNKAKTLYKIDACAVVSLTMNMAGTELISGHVDGCIYRFVIPTKTQNSSCIRLVTCATVPYVVAWGKSICVAGLDDKISFYNVEGIEEQTFSYDTHDHSSSSSNHTGEEGIVPSTEFCTSCCSPSGDSIIIGSFNCFYQFYWETRHKSWQEKPVHFVKHMYSVTAIDWKRNGSSFALGTSSGLVDEYDAAFRQYIYKDVFNIKYISPSQILIRDNEEINASPVVLESTRGEITKVNIYHEPGTTIYRYIVAKTSHSLILCDMESPAQLTSEINWHFDNDAKEKFIFEAANACMICKDGEIIIVEYGQDVILTSVQTKFHSACLMSLRVMESVCCTPQQQITSKNSSSFSKMFTYLLDQCTICIKDIAKMTSVSLEHNVAIDFLELNTTCTHLIFRDKKQNLILYHIAARTKYQILSNCGYTQWIPCTDVLVAQSGHKMSVWYNILAINQVSCTTINGEIGGIERMNGRTEVMVDVKGTIVAYPLSDDLINFTSAVQSGDLATCVDILEKTPDTSQIQTMWLDLQQMSLQVGILPIAQRCAAALGNVSLVRFIHDALKSVTNYEEANQSANWKVRAQLLQLRKAFSEAEKLYLSYNKIDDAISMYENMIMFEDALRLVKSFKNSDYFEEKKQLYFKTLMDNEQEEKAAQLIDTSGDHIRAISIYLESRLPGRAAQVILEKDIVHPLHLLEGVATNLINLGLMKKAGEIYQKIGQFQNALTYFIKGLDFQEALRLAKMEIPSKVTEIEELWGDYLVSIHQDRQAIDHFISSHTLLKAVDAAINAKAWDKASEIVAQLNDISPHRLGSLATKFLSAKRYRDAELLFMKANMKSEIVSMYLRNERWDDAINRARDLLPNSEIKALFESEAQIMIEDKKYNAAEKSFLLSSNPKMAIEMWKNINNFDNAMIVVNNHCQELFVETHQFFAQARENEDLLEEAEVLYINGGDWLGAINMYRKNGRWNDAIRVAKTSEDDDVLNRVAYAYSIFLGATAQEVLSSMELLDNAIDFAIENESFHNAIALAKGVKSKEFLASIHLKLAQTLEDCGKVEDAEDEYIEGGNISAAIQMYMRLKAWDDAERIAKSLGTKELRSVLLAKANHAAETKNFKYAEELYIECGNPDLVLDVYKRNELWEDALRISRVYLQHREAEIKKAFEESNNQGLTNYIYQGKEFEKAKRFDEAIDTYLQPQAAKYDANPYDLEKIWNNAVRLVKTKCPHRAEEVCSCVASRLCDLGLIIKAVEVFSQCDETESALKLLIEAKHWEQAKEYAQGDDQLTSIYFDAFRKYLVQQEKSNDLLRLGETKAAFDIMMKNGEWDRIWSTLRNYKELRPEDYEDYTVRRMEELLNESDTNNIRKILSTILTERAPIPDYHLHLNLYLALAQQALHLNNRKEDSLDYQEILHDLKVVLTSSFMKFHPGSNRREGVMKSFIHLLMAVHFYHLMHLCELNGLSIVACKCSLTLLRYAVLEVNGTKTQLIPADKIFYRAGALCRKTNHKQLAFVLLNTYIDIVEAIEEGDEDLSSLTSYDDFDSSTNIPVDSIQLPTEHYIPDDDLREEIQDWVLGICIDSSVERVLPEVGKIISGELYEGLYDFPTSEKCIVTGFPIPEGNLMKVENIETNEVDWNAFVNKFGYEPWNDIRVSSDTLRL